MTETGRWDDVQDRSRQVPQIMAVWVPDWPVTVAMNVADLTAEVPAAVEDGRTIVAASAMARAQGVRRGMRRRTAQEVCPDLHILPRDYPAEVREFEFVAQAVERLLANLTVMRPGLLWARQPDTGRRRTDLMMGGDGATTVLAGQITDAVALTTGGDCMVGAGGTSFAAIIAARSGVFIPSADTADFLRRQPVTALHYMSSESSAREMAALTELTALLVRLGVFTLGDFLALTPKAVRTRFGAQGLWAYRLAGGEPDRATDHWQPTEPLTVSQELDPPALQSETVMFAAQPMAQRLHQMLLEQSLVCARIQISATTTQGDTLTRCWQADAAMLGGMTPRQIGDRVRWQLDGWLRRAEESPKNHHKPGTEEVDPEVSPVRELQIAAVEVQAAPIQGEALWGSTDAGATRAHRTADRLHGLLGEGGVFTALPQGGRTPRDQVAIVPWGQAPARIKPRDRPWPQSLPGPAPTNIPTEPRPLAVWDEKGEALLVSERLNMRGQPHRIQFPHGPIQSIIHWAGPWPIVERWWASDGRRAVYLQVVVESGEGLLLSCSDRQWRCEGWYD